MNTPYVKQLDENGKVTNPITQANPFLNHSQNRKQRREKFDKRFRGNNAGHAIVVLGNLKYFKVTQLVDGKTINHSLTKN